MRNVIHTDQAPIAIGPYSQAISVDGFLFISGQLPIDPATGEMAKRAGKQTKQSLENIRAILRAEGMDMGDIVKTTVFLQDMSDFSEMNQVYETFFEKGSYPARSAFQVAELPKNALVEIEAIAKR